MKTKRHLILLCLLLAGILAALMCIAGIAATMARPSAKVAEADGPNQPADV